MSEFDETTSTEDDERLDPAIREQLKRTKELKREAEQAKADLDAVKRDLAFTKAGVPEDGVGALLRKAYDGDIDPEAIRTAAAQYGIGSAPQTEEQGEDFRQELETHRQIAGSTGSTNSGPTKEQEFLAAIGEAESEADVMALIKARGAESGVFVSGSQ